MQSDRLPLVEWNTVNQNEPWNSLAYIQTVQRDIKWHSVVWNCLVYIQTVQDSNKLAENFEKKLNNAVHETKEKNQVSPLIFSWWNK